ncbi:hypothetical protein H6P81_016487 [Aristolochia fimbriata]|uniref:Cytochrome P450 n=1 Tax=Aristolochia fimbriata TaxID=158543 RepID=A0AAV7E8H7_ARIFI|nr:hypothetical protein H6P81_016487 [Aristolochia fimbriata]
MTSWSLLEERNCYGRRILEMMWEGGEQRGHESDEGRESRRRRKRRRRRPIQRTLTTLRAVSLFRYRNFVQAVLGFSYASEGYLSSASLSVSCSAPSRVTSISDTVHMDLLSPFLIGAGAFLILLSICFSTVLVFTLLGKSIGDPSYHPVTGTVFHQLVYFHRLFDYLTDISRKHPTYRLLAPFQSELYTVDPRIVEHILKTNFDNYPKGQYTHEIFRDLFGDGIFGVDGDKWRRQRKLASFGFSTRVLRDFSCAIFRKNAAKLAGIVKGFAEEKAAFDIQDLLMKCALDSIFEVGFGVNLNCLDGSTEAGITFSKAFDESNGLVYWRYPDVFWKIKKLLNVGSERTLKRNIELIDSFVYALIRHKRQMLSDYKGDGRGGKEDILAVFILESDKDPEGMNDQYLRDIILNFIIAGKDTTASTLSWFFYMLCRYPSIQEKITQQIKDVVNDEEDLNGFVGGLTDAALDKMHYLHAALTETLRLYPAVPIDRKCAVVDDVLPDGFKLKKGDGVNYFAYGMGRMKSIWGEDAEEFRPERWLEDGIFRPESPFKFVAFHAGPRICLGKEFAYRQMKIIAMTLLRFFRFQLNDESREMDIYFTVLIATGITIFLLLISFSIFLLRIFTGKSTSNPDYPPPVATVYHQLFHFDTLFDYLGGFSRRRSTFRLLALSHSDLYTVDPRNVEYILKTNFENYSKGLYTYGIVADLFGDGIFAVDGEKWRKQRKLASFELSTRVLRDFSSGIFRKNSLKLAQIVRKFAEDQRTGFDIQELLMKCALDSIFEVGFGVDLNCLEGSNEVGSRFIKAFDESNALVYWRYADFLWKIKRFLNVGSEAKLRKNIDLIDDFVYRLIRIKKEKFHNQSDHGVKEDILSRFLGESETDPENMTDRYLRDIILNFIIAGKDSTANTLSWFFYMLCKHPLIQEKLHEQVRDQVNNIHGDHRRMNDFVSELQDGVLDKMHYLHAALTETLRLYPAVPIDGRCAQADDVLPDGFRLKKGDEISYMGYAMGRTRSIWGEDAEEFRPERWLEEGIFRPESPFKFVAFHAGPRICLGKEFAYRQMKIIAMVLLRYFRFRVEDEKKDVTYRTMFTLHIKGGLHLRAFSRNI